MAIEQNGTNRIKKITAAALALGVFAVSLCGCGAKKSPETSLSIDKDGVITSVLVESFDQDYYSLTELQDMVADEISYYNSEYTTPKISLEESLVSEEGVAVLTMKYNSYIDYAHFNQMTFFYGTVDDAKDRGFAIDKDLVDTKGETGAIDEIEDLGLRHIIIAGEKIGISTPFNISYMSKGVVLKDKKEADLSGVTSDTVQLLLSK